MPRKQRIYCGEEEELPKGYARNGTRFECLKKGYGSALIYSTEEQRKNAIRKMMSNPPSRISREQLTSVAHRLSVPTTTGEGKNKTKEQIISGMLQRLKEIK